MTEAMVIGWCDAWTSPYKQVDFTKDRRRALVERIKKRGYNFTYNAHQTLPYAAPFYNDKVICVLSKEDWDSVLDEVYEDRSRGSRLMPMDVITSDPVNDVLFEKDKWREEAIKNG